MGTFPSCDIAARPAHGTIPSTHPETRSCGRMSLKIGNGQTIERPRDGGAYPVAAARGRACAVSGSLSHVTARKATASVDGTGRTDLSARTSALPWRLAALVSGWSLLRACDGRSGRRCLRVGRRL